MTNAEYEQSCITAAGFAEKFKGEHLLKQYDEQIAACEATLTRLQAERREVINRRDLNKCDHNMVSHAFGLMKCTLCGREVSISGTRN